MALNIHNDIKNKLKTLKSNKNIPNIIFYGPYGSGKRTLVEDFVSSLYDNNKEAIRSYVLYANCAQGKGIKFIREELKFFAKANIQSNEGANFKTIVLLNADQLTIDAQSALRRCIELFSTTTRFFIIVENKNNLLLPILSRFCCIYIPLIKGNLYKYNIDLNCKTPEFNKKRSNYLKQKLNLIKKNKIDIIELTNTLYNNAYSALDLINEYMNMPITKELSDVIYKLSNYKTEIKDEKNMIFISLLLYSFIS